MLPTHLALILWANPEFLFPIYFIFFTLNCFVRTQYFLFSLLLLLFVVLFIQARNRKNLGNSSSNSTANLNKSSSSTGSSGSPSSIGHTSSHLKSANKPQNRGHYDVWTKLRWFGGFCLLLVPAYFGYIGYLETRVNTPFDTRKVS